MYRQGERIIVKSLLIELFPLLPWQPGTKSLKIFFSLWNGPISNILSPNYSFIDSL
jgi:hypothetical protein